MGREMARPGLPKNPFAKQDSVYPTNRKQTGLYVFVGRAETGLRERGAHAGCTRVWGRAGRGGGGGERPGGACALPARLRG